MQLQYFPLCLDFPPFPAALLSQIGAWFGDVWWGMQNECYLAFSLSFAFAFATFAFSAFATFSVFTFATFAFASTCKNLRVAGPM